MSVLKKELRKYEKLDRKDYFEKNEELGKTLWDRQELPTIGDIADYKKGTVTRKMASIFEFFDNQEEFEGMIFKSDRLYEQDESNTFIRKVMASNNKDISDSGYLYKLLMASLDDFTITHETCNSKGWELNVKDDFDEPTFNFYLKNMYVTEFDDYASGHFDEFFEVYSDKIPKDGIIHIQTPMTCDYNSQHTVCRKCSGILPVGLVNIGTFTALCVTEFATQAALSSMNKGLKQNINEIIQMGYNSGGNNRNDIYKWIYDMLDNLVGGPVQSRFYQIAYLSRIREDANGDPVVMSLKNSIAHSSNLFGSYIFATGRKQLNLMIQAKDFDDNSIKLKIATNNFNK